MKQMEYLPHTSIHMLSEGKELEDMWLLVIGNHTSCVMQFFLLSATFKLLSVPVLDNSFVPPAGFILVYMM